MSPPDHAQAAPRPLDGSVSSAPEIRGIGRPAELIALVLALEERDQQSPRDRLRLDREIGARHGAAIGQSGTELLRHWLTVAPSPATQERIARVRSALTWLRWLLMGVGLFAGWAAAAALLQVEVHAGRINIVLCLGVLVVLPLLLLLAALVGTVWSRRNPESSGRGFWTLLLGRGAMRLVSAKVREDLEILVGRVTAHARLYAGVQRAQLLLWSQWMGLGFAAGALLATLLFVVFTDLAFGWSTTLDVAAAGVHRLVEGAAWPWAAVWPEASPSLELVESTRHFRVAARTGSPDSVDPILFGGWWPFLVMALLVYSVLPRALATVGASGWLSREVGRAIARTPGVERLLERLTTPFVETQAEEAEAPVGLPERGMTPSVEARAWMTKQGGEAPTAIRWAEASNDAALLAALGIPTLQVRDAGGRRTLADDAALVSACGTAAGAVALCVRAFEPPVLDVLDFLSDLRRAIGPDRGLAVFLLGGDADDHAAWQNKLMGLGDPGLVVAVLEGEHDG